MDLECFTFGFTFRLLSDYVMKEQVDEIQKNGGNIGSCFGGAYTCHNCESKGEDTWIKKPDRKAEEQGRIIRCSNCYITAYCSEVREIHLRSMYDKATQMSI